DVLPSGSGDPETRLPTNDKANLVVGLIDNDEVSRTFTQGNSVICDVNPTPVRRSTRRSEIEVVPVKVCSCGVQPKSPDVIPRSVSVFKHIEISPLSAVLPVPDHDVDAGEMAAAAAFADVQVDRRAMVKMLIPE